MIQKTKKIWFNGKFVNWDNAKVHVLTHSLHYGAAAFEGIRFYKTKKGSAIFRLNEHIDRLFYSAESIYMKIPFSKTEIKKAIIKLIKINKIDEGYIRPIVFYGYGIMGLDPTLAPVNVAVITWPWGAYFGKKGIKVKVSSFIRIHPKSMHADAKISGNYVNSILASLEAKKQGFDEALLLDYHGNLAEGPGENIFIVKNKVLKTPKLKKQILAGITRDSIIKITKEFGIKIEEKDLRLKELYTADEVFFTGTAAEVNQIAQIDNKIINKGKIGEITEKLSKAYSEIVHGKNLKYKRWLTYI